MNSIRSFQIAMVTCLVAVLAGCETGALKANSCANVDALEDWWEIYDATPSLAPDHFSIGDTYQIEKKTDGFYFKPKLAMTQKKSWEDHKGKLYKMEVISHGKNKECQVLCLKQLKLKNHKDDQNKDIEKEHNFSFYPPNVSGKSKIIVSDQGCVVGDNHGGTAHGQNN